MNLLVLLPVEPSSRGQGDNSLWGGVYVLSSSVDGPVQGTCCSSGTLWCLKSGLVRVFAGRNPLSDHQYVPVCTSHRLGRTQWVWVQTFGWDCRLEKGGRRERETPCGQEEARPQPADHPQEDLTLLRLPAGSRWSPGLFTCSDISVFVSCICLSRLFFELFHCLLTLFLFISHMQLFFPSSRRSPSLNTLSDR